MTWHRVFSLFLICLMGLAFVGYLVGIQDAVRLSGSGGEESGIQAYASQPRPQDPKLIPALAYADIPQAVMGPTALFRVEPKPLPRPVDYDLFGEVRPSETDKQVSSQLRSSRRAYNGAPPIIPHGVQDTNDAACYACHAQGMQIGGRRASAMSHAYLANCTQCHAPPAPPPFADVDNEVATNFVGLPAPLRGQRAFPGAPPSIPHSQWMRENCLACHGGPYGWPGMESTHPWRSNCTQCHAPSATLDQAIPVDQVPMLPPLEIVPEPFPTL